MQAAPGNNDRTASSDRPRLRGDLRVTVDSDGAFILEDPSRLQFYRVGAAEYRVLSQLDGKTSLSEVALRARPNNEGPAMPAAQLHALHQWLLATHLLADSASISAGLTPATSATALNPCYMRIPIRAGGQTLARLTTQFGWLFSWPAAAVMLLLTIAAAFQITLHWTAFSSSMQRVLFADQHVLLAACWLVLKLVHELGHGIASKRLGGDVREFGVAMIFFVPVPYTDVTASWRCTRMERMVVAAAGMYFEWIISLVAVAVWSWSSNPAVRQVCVYVVSLATLTTILFNANPLCRMDGHYLLTDLLGWQNLAAQGQRVSGDWLSWLLLGHPPTVTEVAARRYLAIGCYGLAARLWRSLSLLTMAVLVLMMYEGLGLLFLAAIALLWHVQSRGWRIFAANKRPGPTKSRTWPLVRLVVIASAVALIWWCVPWPGGVTAPGAVENVQRHVVRATRPAQVVAILVENGQHVDAGQEIARLQCDELALELADLEFAFAQGEIRQRTQRTKRLLVDLQVEQRRQQSLTERIEDCRRKLSDLTLRAPIAGRVVARRLGDLPGSYLSEGAEICSLVSDDQEFRVMIAQQDLPAFTARLGQPVNVAFAGQQTRGTLASIQPQATTSIAETNLGAHVGGPLAVVPGANSGGSQSTWELSEPRIVGQITLDHELATPLRVGQRGYVSLRPASYTVGRRITTAVNDWLNRLSRQSNDH